MEHEGGSRMPLVRSASSVEELEVGNIHGPSNTTVYESSGNGPNRRLVIPATGAAPDAVELIRALGQGQGGVIMNLAPRIVNLGHMDQKVVRAKGATGVVLMNTGEVVGNDGTMTQNVYDGVDMGTIIESAEHDNVWEMFFGKSGPGHSKPGLGCYQLEGKACALIINNVFNAEENPPPSYACLRRNGAEKDADRMEALFRDLHFKLVEKQSDVGSGELSGILTNFRKRAKRQKCSSCFIVIMSHGGYTADSIVMDDVEEVDLYRDIVYPFSDHEDFREKPKIFIVQACRNLRDAPERREQDSHRKIQDVLIAHSTIPHETADRTMSVGAFYISEIDKTFRKYARTEPLDKMLYLVFKEVQKKYGQNSNFQNIGFGEYRFKFDDDPPEERKGDVQQV